MTEKERRKRIEEVATRLREAFGKLPWQEQDLAAEALLAAVGTPKLRNMTEYVLGGDEFADDEDDHPLPLEAASGGDFYGTAPRTP
jgi:hypothetical protein